jgi:hypothetical protein
MSGVEPAPNGYYIARVWTAAHRYCRARGGQLEFADVPDVADFGESTAVGRMERGAFGPIIARRSCVQTRSLVRFDHARVQMPDPEKTMRRYCRVKIALASLAVRRVSRSTCSPAAAADKAADQFINDVTGGAKATRVTARRQSMFPRTRR